MDIIFESAVKARCHLDGPGAIQRLLKHVWYTHHAAIGAMLSHDLEYRSGSENGDGSIRVGNDSRESMSGGAFLSESFTRVLSRISAAEQICDPILDSYLLCGYGRI